MHMFNPQQKLSLQGKRIIAAVGLLILLASLLSSTAAICKAQHGRKAGRTLHLRPAYPRSNNGRLNFNQRKNLPKSSPKAVQLLFRSFRPTVPFRADQRTQVGSKVSEQILESAPNGKTRRDFISPPFNGDILITAPGLYVSYTARSHRANVALWPKGVRVQQVLHIRNLIRRHILTVTQTGQETIAGMPCVILKLALYQQGNPQGLTQGKFWVNPQTGILMRYERWNSSGIVSISYITSITTGAGAHITNQDFTMRALPADAAIVPLPGPQRSLASIQQAETEAHFNTLQPSFLPGGYQLTGVWVFPHRRFPSILLRFSKGINHFSLYEQVAREKPFWKKIGPPPHARRNLISWLQRSGTQTLRITYIGHLPPHQIELIIHSLH